MLRGAAVLCAILIASSATAQISGVRQIDFRNFTYPWDEPPLGVPGSWQWLRQTPKDVLQLADGRHNFVEVGAPDRGQPYVALRSVTYGDLDGDGYDEAAVDLVYGTGGTANWHYLYVYSAVNGTKRFIDRLESGSRADGGLVSVAISRGLLVLDFADSERRQGDCCSSGVIRVSYLLQDGSFVETKPYQKDSLRVTVYPLGLPGPLTVRASSGNIVYTNASGKENTLTSSGRDSQPALSADKSLIVFLRRKRENENEVRMIRADGGGERLLFPTAKHLAVAGRSGFACDSPQFALDQRSVYFITEFTAESGAIWKLDGASGNATVIVPGAAQFGIVNLGRYRGYLIANQRSLSQPDSEGMQYPEYPFFLFTPEGKKIAKVGEDVQDLDSFLEDHAAE